MLIERFDVPPEADAAFLTEWRRERGAPGATLYRAIRADTPARFVSIATGDAYEIVHEDGDVDSPGGVIQIGTFAAGDAEFLPDWRRLHDIETERRGYLGARLYRSTAPAEREFIAIARWSSPLMVFRTQRQPEFRAVATGLPVAAESALYTRSDATLREPD